MQAIPYLMMAGQAVSAISTMQAGNYQAAVANNNAAIAEKNAVRLAEANALESQDTDRKANLEIGQILANASASGLDVSSGSKLLSVTSARYLAGQDRQRLADAGAVDVENMLNQAADQRSAAKAAKSSSSLQAFTGLLNIGTSYLSGANLVNQYKGIKAGMTV